MENSLKQEKSKRTRNRKPNRPLFSEETTRKVIGELVEKQKLKRKNIKNKPKNI